ncbi:MAG: YihY/virulence factor BrkB family protein [Bacteroidales bacterium]|nr:YihY/virulence factor BrkB family protein [Bacteroidales bacterium]
MVKVSKWIKSKVKYVTEDIWNIPLSELPKRKSFLIREIRILALAFKGFTEDKVQLRASALTFNTLLSIVPIVALAFGVAKGFGFEKKLETEIMSSFEGHQEVMNYVLQLARGFLQNTKGGFIALFGLAILFWSVMQVLSHIEKSFNHIWQIKKSRHWGRKFSDYLSIMIFGPLLLIVAGSVNVYISTTVDVISDKVAVVHTIEPMIAFLLKFTPFVIMWLVFTLLYLIMPNTKVKFKSALVAGIIAGTIFQITQYMYIHFQLGVTKYNAIYGSFAAFPLFIIWLQISWLVVLLGAEISFANQNVQKYEFEYESLKISQYHKRILTFMIFSIIVKRFVSGDPPLSAVGLSKEIQTPIRLSRDILYNLNQAGLVTEINVEAPRERLYQPATDSSKLNIHFVLSKLENLGSDDVPVMKNVEYKKIEGLIIEFGEKLRKSSVNILVKDI